MRGAASNGKRSGRGMCLVLGKRRPRALGEFPNGGDPISCSTSAAGLRRLLIALVFAQFPRSPFDSAVDFAFEPREELPHARKGRSFSQLPKQDDQFPIELLFAGRNFVRRHLLLKLDRIQRLKQLGIRDVLQLGIQDLSAFVPSKQRPQ